ncbi:AMP-binding protein [Synechococcus sp. CBW1004]|uniref:non-ribosomal peptide synthetase n=1 Tax=Synechococcus sp. CBW1004 TaxID=1353136 RepID=UPI001E639D38|nr:AMP-binding protein [Synechococcus sp. CBW1004]
MQAQIHALANALSSQGVQRNDRLALVMTPGTAMAATLLAAMAVAAVAPLMPSSPLPIILDDLRRLGATHVLVDENPPATFLEAAGQLGLPVLSLPSLMVPDELSGIAVTPESGDLALLLQTSGTTSRPKVVPLSHANLLTSAGNIATTLKLSPTDRSIAAMPLFHIHGIVASLLAPLLAGGSVICCRSSDPEQLLAAIHHLQATYLSAVPTLLQALLNNSNQQGEPPGFNHLRFLRSSSSPLSPVLQQRLEHHFGVPVLEAYGMTEAAHQICSNRLPGEGPTPLPGSVGPAVGPEVMVLGPEHRPLPAGESGEVAIRGPNVTAGYEAADLSGWVTAFNGESWFLTGDEGYLDQEGRLFLTGRLKEMINRGGEKVIPRRVDEALLLHPGVDQALAFAVPHPTLGEDLAAAVVLRAGLNLEEQQLRQHAFSVLAPHEVPSRILILEELPRGVTGKLQRIGLAERLADALRPAEEPAVGELEELVASVISEVLELKELPSREANFFQIGGDSLAGTRVITRLAEQLSLDLQPTLLFTVPTVRTLAEKLDQLLDETLAQLEELP